MTPSSASVPALWLDDLEQASVSHLDWLWQGYLAPGNVTLLTSQWKTGKTTLLALLLDRMKSGGVLAGLPVCSRQRRTVRLRRCHAGDALVCRGRQCGPSPPPPGLVATRGDAAPPSDGVERRRPRVCAAGGAGKGAGADAASGIMAGAGE